MVFEGAQRQPRRGARVPRVPFRKTARLSGRRCCSRAGRGCVCSRAVPATRPIRTERVLVAWTILGRRPLSKIAVRAPEPRCDQRRVAQGALPRADRRRHTRQSGSPVFARDHPRALVAGGLALFAVETALRGCRPTRRRARGSSPRSRSRRSPDVGAARALRAALTWAAAAAALVHSWRAPPAAASGGLGHRRGPDAAEQSPGAGDQPSVLVIVVDTLRADPPQLLTTGGRQARRSTGSRARARSSGPGVLAVELDETGDRVALHGTLPAPATRRSTSAFAPSRRRGGDDDSRGVLRQRGYRTAVPSANPVGHARVRLRPGRRRLRLGLRRGASRA